MVFPIRSFLLSALMMCVPLQGCGITSGKADAEVAVTLFHEQLNATDFDAIWNDSDARFREATTREQYEALMGAVHRKLGRVVSTKTTDWSVRNVNLQTSVVLLQETQFERGTGRETFTYVAQGGGVKLLGYNINSMQLITQ